MSKLETRVLRALELAKRVAADRAPSGTFGAVLDAAIELTGAESGYVVHVNREGALDVVAGRVHGREEVPKPERRVSQTIVRKAMAARASRLIHDIGIDPEYVGIKSSK